MYISIESVDMAVENRSGELLTPTSLGRQSPLPIKARVSAPDLKKRCLRDGYGESLLGRRNSVIQILKRLSASIWEGNFGADKVVNIGFNHDSPKWPPKELETSLLHDSWGFSKIEVFLVISLIFYSF